MSVNNFGLFFTRDGTVIRLPVNPEKLPMARDNDNSEYNVLGIRPHHDSPAYPSCGR